MDVVPQIQLGKAQFQMSLLFPVRDTWRINAGPEPGVEWESVVMRCYPCEDVGACFRDFLALSEKDTDPGTVEAVAEFSKKWGLLCLWPDVYPERAFLTEVNTDEPTQWLLVDRVFCENNFVSLSRPAVPHERCREPLWVWFALADLLRALLSLSADVMAGERTRYADWLSLSQFKLTFLFGYPGRYIGDDVAARWSGLDAEGQRDALHLILSSLIRFASVAPTLRWQGNDPPSLQVGTDAMFHERAVESWMVKRLNSVIDSASLLGRPLERTDCELSRMPEPDFLRYKFLDPCPSPLYNLLVWHTVGLLTSANGIYRCDNCGTVFTPENRRARADRRRFCGEWCAKQGHLAIARESARRRRGKQKQTSPFP